jgi:hypothetical protein
MSSLQKGITADFHSETRVVSIEVTQKAFVSIREIREICGFYSGLKYVKLFQFTTH